MHLSPPSCPSGFVSLLKPPTHSTELVVGHGPDSSLWILSSRPNGIMELFPISVYALICFYTKDCPIYSPSMQRCFGSFLCLINTPLKIHNKWKMFWFSVRTAQGSWVKSVGRWMQNKEHKIQATSQKNKQGKAPRFSEPLLWQELFGEESVPRTEWLNLVGKRRLMPSILTCLIFITTPDSIFLQKIEIFPLVYFSKYIPLYAMIWGTWILNRPSNYLWPSWEDPRVQLPGKSRSRPGFKNHPPALAHGIFHQDTLRNNHKQSS